MIEYLLLFLAGMAGSWHCVGMCGGFACTLGADPRGRGATWVRQLTYNVGRMSSYCFLGGLAGYLAAALGAGAGDAAPGAAAAQRALAVASGLLMVWIGLGFLGWLPRRHGAPLEGFGTRFVARALRDLLRAPGPAVPLAFGVFNGFLPCPLVYAFAAQAAGSGGALPGMLVMLAFGLGTFPAMLAMGGLGGWVRGAAAAPGGPEAPAVAHIGAGAGRWRRRGVDLAGAFIVLLGLITLVRGIVPMGGHLHAL